MPAEKIDATRGAGEKIYLGLAKYNAAVDIINAIETKIASIESGAEGDQSGAEIKALLEALANKLSIETGVKETTDKKIMTATERTSLAANVAKLAGIEANAKDDQTGGEIVTLLEALAGDAQLSLAKIKDTAAYKKLTAARQTAIDAFLSNYFVDGTRKLGGDLDANNHSINNLLGIGATPISAAQWGYLGALSSHPDKPVAQTDTFPFVSLDNQSDIAWTDVDANTAGSGSVPTDAIGVFLDVGFNCVTQGAMLQFRKNGETDANQVQSLTAVIASQWMNRLVFLGLDANGVFEYQVTGAGVDDAKIRIRLAGWIEPS